MSLIKGFAYWLAKCIHVQKMTDEEIIQSAKAIYKFDEKDNDWLKQQIAIVNADPFYIRLANRNQ